MIANVIESNIPILLVALPLVGAFLVTLTKLTRSPRLSGWISVVVLSAVAVLAAAAVRTLAAGDTGEYVVGNWAREVGIVIQLTGPAWLTAVAIIGIGLMAVLYSLGHNHESPTYYTLVLLLLGGMLGVVVSADIFNIVVFFEIMAVSSYVLVAYTMEGRAIKASFVYLVLSSLGLAFVFIGVAILYQQTGTLLLSEMAVRMRSLTAEEGRRAGFAISLCVAGFGVKAAFVPLHFWLPDAHANAPTPVSALLSGVLIKVGFLVIHRLTAAFESVNIQGAFLWIGAVTAVWGVFLALAQTDIKKILAYHSVSQMGYILVAYGAAAAPWLGSAERLVALAAAFLHLLNHAMFKSLLFLAAGGAIEAGGTRDTRRLGGLLGLAPVSAVACFAGALAISGIPPFNGYISKSLVTAAASANAVAATLVGITSVGTVASFAKVTKVFWGRKDADAGCGVGPRPAHEPFLVSFSLLVLALVCFALGAFPGSVDWLLSLVFASRFDTSLVYQTDDLASSMMSLILGVLLFVAVESPPGRRLCARVKGIEVGLGVSMVLLVGTVILLTVIENSARLL